MKYALIVGGLAAVMMLGCCGGLVWLGWGFIPKIVTAPAEIAELSEQTMKIDVPSEFTPDSGMSMDNWLLAMRFATYRHKDGAGILLIGSLEVKIGDRDQQRADFKKQASERSGEAYKLNIKSTVEREFTVRGKPVKFQFSEATKAEGGEPFRLVSADFDGPTGITLFQLMLKEAAYDEEAVVKMIESIR